jgi:hypothetical protein
LAVSDAQRRRSRAQGDTSIGMLARRDVQTYMLRRNIDDLWAARRRARRVPARITHKE